MRRALLLVAAAACTRGATPTTPSPTGTTNTMWPSIDEAFLTASAETNRFTLGLPTLAGITRDGAVLFRRTGPRSRAADLFELGAGGRERRLASAADLLDGGREQLSDAEKARRERTRTQTTGIVRVHASRDGRWVLVPVGERLFVLDRQAADPATSAREVNVGPGFPFDPQLAPTGDRLAFVRDGAVWLSAVSAAAGATAAAAAPRRLTPAGTDTIEYGVAEFAAQEELDRTTGMWWSPTGDRLLIQRSDHGKVDTLHVSDPRHPDQAPVPFRYPRAGRANSDVTFWLYAVGTGASSAAAGALAPLEVRWDHARYPYVAAVDWPDAGPLTLTVLDRDQGELALLAVDPATGATRALVEERDAAWVNVGGGPWWLADGSGFLWTTEAPGAWVLQHRAADGRVVRQLTEPSFGLRDVAGVDDERGVVWVTAGTDPTRDDVYTVALASGATTPVPDDGVQHLVAHDHGRTVVYAVPAQGLAHVRVIDRAGTSTPLTSHAEAPPYWPTTQLETVRADGHDFHVAVTRPRAFDPGKRYPVLHFVYGGPHAQQVMAPSRGYFGDQLYADAGFIVVRGDGRGTPSRDRAWERALLGDLATVPVADSVTILRAVAAKHPEIDLARAGVYGWSFGGYLSALLTIQHPELYKAGIAGAPVTDWELYDTAYTERYMKQPADNREGYQRGNVMTYASQLRRPLLLLHGITDDNVHFAHTLALIEALYLEGKRAELVTLSSTHMVPDPKMKLALERVQLEFFRQHLGPPP